MKKTPINRIGKITKLRNKNLAKLKPPKDGLCQECHLKPDWRGLARHHIIKRSQGGNENPENIIWLCGKCHAKNHGRIEL